MPHSTMQLLVLLILACATTQFVARANIVSPVQDSSSRSSSSSSSSSSISSSSSNSSGQTNRPPGQCQLSNEGLVTLNVDFISYHNPSDSKATGQSCDPDSSCDVFFDICVSRINSNDCELLSGVTEVIANHTVVSFGHYLGGLTNPISVTIPALSWEGVRIDVYVWDEDPRRRLNDFIDEFSIEYTGEPGSYPEVILARGNRQPPKSTLYLIARAFCPDPITTPTTPVPSSESDLEGICSSALVFNESIRISQTSFSFDPILARNLHINDLVTLHNHTNTTGYYPWFKFKGMAGHKLLTASCSTYSGSSYYMSQGQCGTQNSIYTNNHPIVTYVGIVYPFVAYARTQTSCNGVSLQMHVTLCPNNDLIYRYVGTLASPDYGFCSSYS